MLSLQDLQDSSEEEEEGQNEYDMNDRFLVADEDEDDEDGEEGTEEEKKRRRRRKRKEAQLDEEDYELIVGILALSSTEDASKCLILSGSQDVKIICPSRVDERQCNRGCGPHGPQSSASVSGSLQTPSRGPLPSG